MATIEESTSRPPAPELAAAPRESMSSCSVERPTISEPATKPLGVDSPPRTSPPPSQNASSHSDIVPSGSAAAGLRPISSSASEVVEATPTPSIGEPNPLPTPLSGTFLPPDSSPAAAAAPYPIPEMGQMICGGCRQLLAYKQHAPSVHCMCCHTVNLVLEAHQVGTIRCEKCCALLMYPYGAPAVRCSCCRFVTQINVHNMKPPLSAQQVSPPVHSLPFRIDSPPPGFA